MRCRILHATAANPGAIAIIQLLGECERILIQLTRQRDWPVGRMRLSDLGGIDTGIVVRLDDEIAQIMPHGGPRVVHLLSARLMELGCELATNQQGESPLALFPEARDDIEALMLGTMSRAASPRAIDLLLDQPRRWRELLDGDRGPTADDLARSRRLNRLLTPPLVALAGRPNVGKSTLSNALLGRSMSIALDMPGTTRDYTAGRIDLAGVVVDWFDTPGLRESDDAIERTSIEIAARLMARADLLIAMRDPERDWPPLPRQADVFVLNKIDTLENFAAGAAHDGRASSAPLPISAARLHNLPALVQLISERLVPQADRDHPGPWMFDERLASSSAPVAAKRRQ